MRSQKQSRTGPGRGLNLRAWGPSSPERVALVESVAGVDNHRDPGGGEDHEEGDVAAPAVVADNAAAGSAQLVLAAAGRRGVPTDDGAEWAYHLASSFHGRLWLPRFLARFDLVAFWRVSGEDCEVWTQAGRQQKERRVMGGDMVRSEQSTVLMMTVLTVFLSLPEMTNQTNKFMISQIVHIPIRPNFLHVRK
jgi:hypothetical protein